MATNVYVPPEIIEEILQRLPAKALGRFKCLSKQWKTLISSVRFINNHIDFSTRLSREKLILLLYDDSLCTVDLVDLKNDNVSELMATEVRFVPPYSEFDGSCNGLIATSFFDDVHEEFTMLLVNPTTGEFTEVFKPLELLPKYHRLVDVEVWGFGYDSLTDDYKSVLIIRCRVENVEGNTVRLLVVHSLKSNSLRMDIKPPEYCTGFSFLKAVYLNGCIHWLCDRGSFSSLFIAVFDLQREELKEMGLPRLENFIAYNQLKVVNGCLCVVTTIGGDCDDGFSKEMWVMKEYSVSESWKKISIDGLDTSMVEPLYLLGDREVVLKVLRFEPELLVYNEDKKTVLEVTISGVPTAILHIEGTCVESLVSPTYIYGLKR